MAGKRAAALTIVGLLLAVLLWIFWVTVEQVGTQTLRLTAIECQVVIEEYAALPQGTSTSVMLEHGDEAYEAITTAMEQMRCRRCIHTILDKAFPDGTGLGQMHISYGETSILLTEGSNHVLVNGTVYETSDTAVLYTLCQEQFSL